MELLPIIELFKKSFDAYIKKVWTLAGIVLFSLLGALVLLPFGGAAFLLSFAPFTNHQVSLNLILVDFLLVLIGLFFAILFGVWSQVALYSAVNEQSIGVKQSLAIAWKKIASFF